MPASNTRMSLGRRQVVRPDLGAGHRVGRARHDRAAAVGADRAGDDRHARRALEPADRTLVVAARREQELQVGAFEPFAAAAEHHGAGDAEGQRAAARDGIAADLADQPGAARQLVDRGLALDPMGHPRRDMVRQIGADPRQFVDYRDPDRAQVPGRADAGNLQKLRRVDGAARNDHLARRRHLAVPAVLAIGDAGAAFSVKHQPGRDRLGDDPQIGAPPRLGQKGLRRRAAKPAAARHLRIADAFLVGAVVVLGQPEAGLLRGLDKTMGQGQDRAVILDRQRAALAAVFGIARRRSFPIS